MNQPSSSYKIFSLKALYDWIVAQRQTPHVSVRTSYPGVRAPLQFATHPDKMKFNLSPKSVQGVTFNLETGIISFIATFSGVITSVSFPAGAVESCYAMESREGQQFEVADVTSIDPAQVAQRARPILHIVRSN